MDHLPRPVDGSRLEVPFYAVKQYYEPEDFFAMAGEAHARGIYNPNLVQSNQASRDIFLQEWLFFALLAQVLNQPIDAEDFKSGTGKLTTESLNATLLKWIARETEDMRNGTTPSQRTRYARAGLALSIAQRCIIKYYSYEPLERDAPRDRGHCRCHPLLADGSTARHLRDDSFDEDYALLRLSLAILGRTLQNVRLRQLVELNSRTKFWKDGKGDINKWGYSVFSRQVLLKNGWCPVEVRRLESTFSGVTLVYLASNLKSGARGNRGHDQCHFFTCLAAPIKEPTLHFDRCRDCGRTPERDKRIADIFHRKNIPLVTWTAVEGVVVHECKDPEETVFGALSHRWQDAIIHSDPDKSGDDPGRLHICQIRKLQETFDVLLRSSQQHSSHENIPFWVDTVCTPPLKGADRGPAISDTKRIYKNATKVLVWDRGLLESL